MLEKKVKEKFSKWAFAFFFSMSISILIFVSVLSIIQFKKLLKAADWVDHTYKVVINAEKTLENITYIEFLRRGYLLFGDENYKIEYEKMISTLNMTFIRLYQMVSDNPEQLDHLLEIRLLVEKRLQLMNQIDAVKIKNSANSFETAKLLNTSKLLAEKIRQSTNLFIDKENDFLKDRNKIVKRETKFNSILLVLAHIISLFFLILAFIFLNKSRKEMNEKEKQLRGIIDGAKDIIVVADTKLRFLNFNTAFKKEFSNLFQHEPEIGDPIENSLPQSDGIKEKILDLWKESFSATEPYSKSIEINRGGEVLSYEINSSKLFNNENLLGAVHILRNITERVKAQEELKRANLKLQNTMKELTNKNKKITILLEMSDVMLAANSLTELSMIAAKYAKQILDFSNGHLYIMHPSKNLLESDSSWGSPKVSIRQFSPSECWALRLGKIHSRMKKTDVVCAHSNEDVFHMCVPLRAQNDIFGLLYIEYDDSVSESNLDSNDKLIVGAFAEVTALALANVTLRENLRYQSIRDPLTTLYNRRYLEEFLNKQIAQSERNNESISILMMDLDHFKRINDVHGHDAGDMVLKEFSKILIDDTRPGDIAARFGGEEFIIVFYDTDLDSAYKRAEDIRFNVSRLLIKYGADVLSKITVSIGVSSYPKDGKDTKSLIETADKALYVAKNSGRNKVVSSADLNKHNI